MLPSRLDKLFKFSVILAITLAALILAKNIFVPLVFGALFSIVLLPLEKRIERRTGRIPAIIIVLLLAFIVMGLVMWFVIGQITSLVANMDNIQQNLTLYITSLSESVSERLNISLEEQTQYLRNALSTATLYVGDFVVTTSYTAYFLIQVPIYIFLFLLYRERFREFFLALNPGSDLRWINDIQKVTISYISGLALVTLIAGVLNSIGLLLLGIPNAIFFGFLSGLLTMIPYIGITIGASLPAILALITKDSIWYAIGVIAVHAFVQFLEGNWITPKITGSKISINALTAIVALLIGGKIWGIPGMILALPLVGIAKIIVSYSTDLKPLVILLEDRHPAGNAKKEEKVEAEEKTD